MTVLQGAQYGDGGRHGTEGGPDNVMASVRADPRPSRRPRPSLDEHLAADLRHAILRGELAPGSRLTELDIAARWHVSQGTVRSALKTLLFEGLVESFPRRGTFVASITEEDVLEIYTLRDTLEGMASQRAATRVTEAGRRALERVLKAMRSAVATGNRDRMLDLDFEFHRTLVEMSGHRRLVDIYAKLESQTRLFLGMAHEFHHDLDRLLALHEPLAQAVLAGDAKTAYALASQHSEEDGKKLAATIFARREGHA